jgi:hypothetical protein
MKEFENIDADIGSIVTRSYRINYPVIEIYVAEY